MEVLNRTLALLIYVPSLFLWLLYMFCLPKALHIFQQEGYQFRDYFRWIYKNPKKAFGPGAWQFLICVLYFLAMMAIDIVLEKNNVLSHEWQMIVIGFQLTFMHLLFYVITIRWAIRWRKENKQAKKKLVYTARLKRLIFFCFLALLLTVLSFLSSNSIDYLLGAYFFGMYAKQILIYSFLLFTMPIIVVIGAFIAMPTEMIFNDYYIGRARWKILRPKMSHLIRIGITGSYGKTSTKFILKTILSEKYNVLATPESYNTTMGNVKIIRNELKPEHEVFISEMGARYKGDIRKICDFVYPQIGIITSIGPQHLETFRSIENVANTKAELLRAIPRENEMNLSDWSSAWKNKDSKQKCAIFLPSDDSYCSKLYQEENERRKFSYGIHDTKANVYAKNIKMSSQGCEFTAVTSLGDIHCVSRLLGEHNIQNILGAIAIAVFLGLSKEQIARGVGKIEPVEHRLQLLPNNNGTIVIDDAFNSNPVGSQYALDVLKSFEGRKIIITPGMVELGDKEEEYNEAFGKHMAECVDIAILVGVKRSKPIEKGLIAGGFNQMNMYVVASLEEATKKLGELTKVGDVILFENDLPDNYNE